MTISLKKQLAYLQQAIYNNRSYFMGRKETASTDSIGKNYGIRRRKTVVAAGTYCLGSVVCMFI